MFRITRMYESEINEGGDECVDGINEREVDMRRGLRLIIGWF